MGHRSFCAFLFWMKVLLACTLAFLGLGYFSLLVYQRRQYAVAHPKVWVPPPPEDFIDIPFDGSCSFEPDVAKGQRNRLEPEDGHFFFGFDLQWNNEQPPAIASKMGESHKPLVYNTFININETDFQKTTIDWMAQEAQKAEAMLEITLLPNDPRPDRPTPLRIEDIPDDTLYAFAMQMRRVNSIYGVPVFLRYVHEMNGMWLPAFSQRPRQTIKSFRTLATYVHSLTNMTAMVWSPNIGEAYPWAEGGPSKPVTPETTSLDTNGDGLISEGVDDPYMPYWPGPEYVDWVGFSLYQYSYVESTLQTIARPGYVDFTNPLRGISSKNVPAGPQAQLEFYVRFAQTFNKPFMFSETGAAYHVPGNDAAHGFVPNPGAQADRVNIDIKREWWRGMFDLINTGEFPNIKLACWFEELKNEPSFWDSQIQLQKDYRITWDAPVLNALQADLDNPQYNRKLRWAGDYEWDCTGRLRANR